MLTIPLPPPRSEAESPDVRRHVAMLQALLTNLGSVPTLDFMLILKAWTAEMHVPACICRDECPAAGTDDCKCEGDDEVVDTDCIILRLRLEDTLTPALEAAGG